MYFLNIFNYKNINCLKYLKNTKVNLYNVLVMTKDFNIRNSN